MTESAIEPAGGNPPRRRRRSRGLGKAVGAAAAVVAVGAATAAAVGFGGDNGGTSNASGLPPSTATVDRQTLADTETVDGDLGFGSARTAASRLSGTVTWLAGQGSVVKRGQPLYKVDNRPILLMYGALPAYRRLAPGDEGPDVKQLEQNLRAIGYTGFTVDDEYTSSTADAVSEWQDDAGLEETGVVEPGQILYAAGAIRVDGHEAEVGDAAQPGQGVLTYTGTARVVTVTLDVDDQRLARKGATVGVTLPDGRRVDGKITKIESVIDAGSDNPEAEPETKIEVTVTVGDAKALAEYDRASVDVAFTASQRENVLTVPVAALLALREGGYGVQIVEGSTTRIVAVRTGLFSGGRVEVSGGGLAEGMTVGMPS
jgi:peptidoglycan hydrolase-like protein with peptidoglycan-binding domain